MLLLRLSERFNSHSRRKSVRFSPNRIYPWHAMGIQDRDYMKRGRDEDPRPTAPDDKLEEAVSGFLRRHPRFFLYFAIALVVLAILALVLSR